MSADDTKINSNCGENEKISAELQNLPPRPLKVYSSGILYLIFLFCFFQDFYFRTIQYLHPGFLTIGHRIFRLERNGNPILSFKISSLRRSFFSILIFQSRKGNSGRTETQRHRMSLQSNYKTRENKFVFIWRILPSIVDFYISIVVGQDREARGVLRLETKTNQTFYFFPNQGPVKD